MLPCAEEVGLTDLHSDLSSHFIIAHVQSFTLGAAKAVVARKGVLLHDRVGQTAQRSHHHCKTPINNHLRGPSPDASRTTLPPVTVSDREPWPSRPAPYAPDASIRVDRGAHSYRSFSRPVTGR